MKRRFDRRQLQWFMCMGFVALGAMEAHAATTRVWTGKGTDAMASSPENWSGSAAPANGDHIRFADWHLGNAWTNATWDLEIEPASWTQTVAYAGTVTIQTKYPGQGSFTNLTITGDVVLQGGTWTHEAHPINTSHVETHRLAATVNGRFILGTNALVDLDQKGYGYNQYGAYGYGPGASGRYTGASHGGLGGNSAPWEKVYGSLIFPTNLGSGSFASAGGGAILLRVGQGATIDGEIRAKGGSGANTGAGSSGGSICIFAETLEGAGTLDASGGKNAWNLAGGGGGRIAVHLSGSTSFGSISMRAYGAAAARPVGTSAAGTIYLQSSPQTEGQGTLIIDNNDGSRWTAMTLLPPGAPNLDLFSGIILTNSGWLALNTDTVYDWVNRDNLSTYGPENSALSIRNTNTVSMPVSHFLSDMTLYTLTNLVFSGDLTVSNASWVTKSYAPAAGLEVDGTLRIIGGASLSHWPMSEPNRLVLSVGQDLIIDAASRIDVSGIGFNYGEGPGAGWAGNHNNGTAASYGGLGGLGWTELDTWITYGSVFTPTNMGSSAFRLGGGAAEIHVGGTLVLDGSLCADSMEGGQAGGAGGSVYLTTGKLSGNGTISANSVSTHQYGGGGGRIGVYVTNGTSVGSVEMEAFGNGAIGKCGAAGTIYSQTVDQSPGGGWLLVDNADRATETNVVTDLPPGVQWTEEEYSGCTLKIDRRARVSLTRDLTMGDLYLLDEGARLHLNGHTLRLRSPYHADWGTEDNVVYDGGKILWTQRATLFLIR